MCIFVHYFGSQTMRDTLILLRVDFYVGTKDWICTFNAYVYMYYCNIKELITVEAILQLTIV